MCYIHTEKPGHENKVKYGIKTQGMALALRVENISQARFIDIFNALRFSYHVKRRTNV